MRVNKKGFTLIQTLIVFVIIGSISVLIPTNVSSKILLKFECEKLKEYLLQAQIEAIENKQKVIVNIDKNIISVNQDVKKLSGNTSCDAHEVGFNERGNVTMAKTIVCKSYNNQKMVVINLGSGNIYVK